MISQQVILCGWHECESPAIINLDFADRFFDSWKNYAAKSSIKSQKRNLCVLHASTVRSQYQHVYEQSFPTK